jgi:hypothetical protein
MALLRLPRPMLAHLKNGVRWTAAAGDDGQMLHACLLDAGKAVEPVADDPRAGLDIGRRIGLGRLFGEACNATQLHVDRAAVTCRDGDNEREFSLRSAPCFARYCRQFAAEIGVADLHVAAELVDRVALAHDLHQLLLDEPSHVPFDVDLA